VVESCKPVLGVKSVVVSFLYLSRISELEVGMKYGTSKTTQIRLPEK
jgi:hypothetical protein